MVSEEIGTKLYQKCMLFYTLCLVCAEQLQPNGDIFGFVIYAQNSCSAFACHILI